MRDVALFRSSGNSDLDKAALACASTFHSSPPMVEGRPAEITWVGAVIWNKPWHTLVPAASADGVRSCPSSRHPFPPIDVGLPFQGTAYVRFHIAGDKSVKDLSLVKSSGDGGLDKLTLQCVAAWKYFSPTQNGKPVEIEQQWNMVWELGRK